MGMNLFPSFTKALYCVCLLGVLQESRLRRGCLRVRAEEGGREAQGLVSWGSGVPCAYQLQHGEWCGSWARGHMGGTSNLAWCFQSLVFLS